MKKPKPHVPLGKSARRTTGIEDEAVVVPPNFAWTKSRPGSTDVPVPGRKPDSPLRKLDLSYREPKRLPLDALDADAAPRRTPVVTSHAGALKALRALIDDFERQHGLSSDHLADLLSQIVAERDAGPAGPPPAKAPERWAQRDLNLRETPPVFIRRVYAPWLGTGLTRKHINERDPDLYRALSVWLTRHPEDDIADALPRQEQLTDRLIARLSKHYSPDLLRRIGFAIDARMRKSGESS